MGYLKTALEVAGTYKMESACVSKGSTATGQKNETSETKQNEAKTVAKQKVLSKVALAKKNESREILRFPGNLENP